jgi:tRNA G10  N-methylase Trm11
MDALKTDIKADVIISDLPYGKNTKNISADLYDKFFAHMKKEKLAKKVVLCFSKAANAMQYVEKYKYKLIVCFDYFIHDSLTRQIFVLELE